MQAYEILPKIFEELVDVRWQGQDKARGDLKEFPSLCVWLELLTPLRHRPQKEYRLTVDDGVGNLIIEVESGVIKVDDGYVAKAAMFFQKGVMDRPGSSIVFDTDDGPLGPGTPQALAAAKIILRFCELSQNVKWGHLGATIPTA